MTTAPATVPRGGSRPTKLYTRIMGLLAERIRSGEYKPGSRIPSERELGEIFGVSRITIRQALLGLERQGMLTRRQGKGTFVAHTRIASPIFGYFKFSEAFRAQGYPVSTKVIELTVEIATDDVARELALQSGGMVARLVRLRNVDGSPFALETTYLPVERLPGIEKVNLQARSLYEVIEGDFGLVPTRARETLRPVRLTRQEARQLGVAPDCALLISRTTFDESGVPFEVSRQLIVGERCTLLVDLWARNTTHQALAAGDENQTGFGE